MEFRLYSRELTHEIFQPDTDLAPKPFDIMSASHTLQFEVGRQQWTPNQSHRCLHFIKPAFKGCRRESLVSSAPFPEVPSCASHMVFPLLTRLQLEFRDATILGRSSLFFCHPTTPRKPRNESYMAIGWIWPFSTGLSVTALLMPFQLFIPQKQNDD